MPHPARTEEQKAKEGQDKKKKQKQEDRLPEGTNTALVLRDEENEEEICRQRGEVRFTERAQVLRAIATLPEYQGKGCASALLRSGLERFDAEVRKAFQEATPQGHPFYVKFGWKDVDKMAFDLKKYRLDGYVRKTILHDEGGTRLASIGIVLWV